MPPSIAHIGEQYWTATTTVTLDTTANKGFTNQKRILNI